MATAVPGHDVHDALVVFAEQLLAKLRLYSVFRRIAGCAGIGIAIRPSSRGMQQGDSAS